MDNPRIYFAGTGGQGTLTATRLLGQAALLAGVEAVAGEIHGMAQRGGVVESTLLLGGWRAARIDTEEADILLGFEALESLRALPFLKPGGVVFSSTYAIPPLPVALGKEEYPPLPEIEQDIKAKASRTWFIPSDELGKKAGTRKSGNTVILGAVCASGILPFSLEFLEQAIIQILPAKIQEVNLAAMRLGAEWFRQQA